MKKPVFTSFLFFPLVVFFVFASYSHAADPADARITMQLQREITPPAGEAVYYLKSGDAVKGVQLEEGLDHIKIRQVFGYSGSMVTRLNKADLLSVEPVSAARADITAQEISLKKELPDFHFSRSGLYSFFTDQDYFKVAKSIELLTRLYSGFLVTFSPLIDNTLSRRNYVIIFRMPEEYEAYRYKIAPHLKNAAGFYDISKNQLVFYDFFNSQDYSEIDDFMKQQNRKIKDLRAENQQYKESNYDVYQSNSKVIRDYEDSLSAYSSRLAGQVKDVNIRILRHEAAHQLTFDLMLEGGAENFDTWLLEGLAEYCSTPSIGEKNSEYMKMFRDALSSGSAISISELFSYSRDSRFYTLDEVRMGLAYAESWALFYFLMQPQRRGNFFEYWKALKKTSEVMDDARRIDLAQDILGVSINDLQEQLYMFVAAK